MQIIYGRYVAKSGVKVIMTKNLKDAAWYDGVNTVYIKADGSNVDIYSGLLGHEMFHKMFKSSKVKKLFMEAWNNTPEAKRQEVIDKYMAELKQNKELSAAERINISNEEVAAAYAQELFNSPDVWDFILEGEPSLSDRIIAFFGGVPKRYAFADGMDAAAKRWLNHYKKLFNEVAELNRGESARQNAVVVGKLKTTNESYDAENADFDELTTTNKQKMQVSEGRSALKKQEYEGAAVNSQIIALVEKIQNNDFKQNEKVFLKKLTEDVAKKITELTSIDVTGFKVAIEARQLDHILKQHGKKGRANTSMSNVVDIAKMEYAMQSPDNITLSGKTQAYSYMKDGYNRTADTVLYEKYIGDESYYVVQAVADTNAKTLYIVSTFKGKPEYKKEASQLINAKIPDVTSKNGSVVTSTTSIPDSAEKSNSFDKNSSKNADSGGRSALARDIKATSSDVKEAKAEIARYGIEPGGIVELADSYFDKYSGDFNRTTMRELFLEAARGMLDSDAKVNDEAYSTITDIASELTYNRKDAGFFTNEIREMQRHIRGIAFEVHEKDKGDFDQYGGFGEFRKRHMGRLKLTNDGVAVDSVYGELQNLYGYSYFPEVNTVSEQLMQIAKVADMDADVNLEADYDVSGEVEYNTVKLYNDLAKCFSKKLAPKAARMSKADADAYKARLKARAEVKVAKAIARLEARAERLESRLKADAERKLKNESAKLKADLATDTVFSQSSVDRIMGESEALKELPRGMKSSLAEEIFLDMNESLNEGDRAKLRMEYTVKIKEAILGNEKGKYYGAGIIEQTKLRDEIDAMMREISEAGKASRRSKMAEEVRGEVKSEESKTRRVLAKIYSSLKRIDDTKRRRYAAASDYKGKELGGAIDAL